MERQDRRKLESKQARQSELDLDLFKDGAPQRLLIGVQKPPEFDCAIGRKLVCNPGLSETMQRGVLKDAKQHVAAAPNSCFITSRHHANLFLKYEDVLPLSDIGWLRVCYSMGCRNGLRRIERVCGRN